MKRLMIWVLFVCLLLPVAASATETVDPVTHAKALVEQIIAGDVEAYYDRLSDALREVFPPDAMAAIGEELTEMGGKPLAWNEAGAEGNRVALSLGMERGDMRVEVAFGEVGEVTGLWFEPLQARKTVAVEAKAPYVEVTQDYEGDLSPGTEVTLTAIVHNLPEGKSPRYQWQNDASGEFADVPGADEAVYAFVIDEDTHPAGSNWRVNVFIDP